ncbi:hypothetical protein FACS1894217_04520 [Clostridia bacterium]|nr:hypothetical protein FACS1894217_04520 [Clostridia bacterium]
MVLTVYMVDAKDLAIEERIELQDWLSGNSELMSTIENEADIVDAYVVYGYWRELPGDFMPYRYRCRCWDISGENLLQKSGKAILDRLRQHL